MKKMLATVLFILGVFLASGRTYNFSWSAPSSLSPSYQAPTSSTQTGATVSNVQFVSGPVVFTVNDDVIQEAGQKAHFVYSYTTQRVELRVYRSSVITVSVAEGYKIEEVRFEESQVREIPLWYEGNDGSFRNNTWSAQPTSQTKEIVFEVDATAMLTLTAVTATEATQDNVDEIEFEEETPEVWYNLQGLQIDNPDIAPGVYIVRKGSATRKVIVR